MIEKHGLIVVYFIINEKKNFISLLQTVDRQS